LQLSEILHDDKKIRDLAILGKWTTMLKVGTALIRIFSS
jgi:hypothetical protein